MNFEHRYDIVLLECCNGYALQIACWNDVNLFGCTKFLSCITFKSLELCFLLVPAFTHVCFTPMHAVIG